MRERVGGKMKDRPYYIAQVRVTGEKVLLIDPENAEVEPPVLREAVRASLVKHSDRVFHIAYMRFVGEWVVGHGGNLSRAVTHLRERLDEASES